MPTSDYDIRRNGRLDSLQSIRPAPKSPLILMPNRLTKRHARQLRMILDPATMLDKLSASGWTVEDCIASLADMAKSDDNPRVRLTAHKLLIDMIKEAVDLSGMIAKLEVSRPLPDGSTQSLSTHRVSEAIGSSKLSPYTKGESDVSTSITETRDPIVEGHGEESISTPALRQPGPNGDTEGTGDQDAGADSTGANPTVTKGCAHSPPDSASQSLLPGISVPTPDPDAAAAGGEATHSIQ